MSDRFRVRSKLLAGPTAYAWFWTFVCQLLAAFVIGAVGYFFNDILSNIVGTILGISGISLFGLLMISWVMLFYQRKRERRAGYTTLWAGEEDREIDEVDPSTGLVIRSAGDAPLTKPGRRDARAEAQATARHIRAGGRSPKLPFGWSLRFW